MMATYRRLERQCMAVVAPWIYLLIPGIALHELAHAVVARRYATVTIDWAKPKVEMDWQRNTPIWGFAATYLAPLWLGGLIALLLSQWWPTTSLAISAWIGLNWALLALPSFQDLLILYGVMSQIGGDTDG